MKILLLNPPTLDNKKFIREGRCTQEQGVWATLWPPVSLATIGAVLEQDGHEVRVLDCAAAGIPWSGLGAEITRSAPRLIIWSTGTPSIHNDLSFAAFIKEIDPAITTAVFGTHVTALDRQCLEQFPALDIIIRNEPEMTARELARSLQDGRPCAGIPGVTARSAAGEIIAGPPRPFIEDLDALPFPAWHLLDNTLYRLPSRTFCSADSMPKLIIQQPACAISCRSDASTVSTLLLHVQEILRPLWMISRHSSPT